MVKEVFTVPHDVVTTIETVLFPLIRLISFSKIFDAARYVPVPADLPFKETVTWFAFEMFSIFARSAYAVWSV